MRVLDIIDNTIVDGPGLRISVYFAGCKHHCIGCHNPESWPLTGGKEYTPEQIFEKIKESSKKKITLTGGDPLFQDINELQQLCKLIKENISDSNIWLYTGFKVFDILQWAFKYTNSDNVTTVFGRYNVLVKYIDTVVDGPFIEKHKDETLQFCGSSNQRIINLNDESIVQFRKKYINKLYEKHLCSDFITENFEKLCN